MPSGTPGGDQFVANRSREGQVGDGAAQTPQLAAAKWEFDSAEAVLLCGDTPQAATSARTAAIVASGGWNIAAHPGCAPFPKLQLQVHLKSRGNRDISRSWPIF